MTIPRFDTVYRLREDVNVTVSSNICEDDMHNQKERLSRYLLLRDSGREDDGEEN